MEKLQQSVAENKLGRFRRWANVDLLIIDEISMVGSRTFNQINQRLQQIMKNNLPFGGISLICYVDFNRLRPVGDRYVFCPPNLNA